MSGWHEPQRAVRLIILFLLMFLLNPEVTKSMEAASNLPHSHSANIDKRNLEDSKIDIHLLYNAYRERVKEGNVEMRYSPGLLHDNSAVAVAEEGEADSMPKYGDGVSMKDLTDMSNELLEELKMVSPYPKKIDSNDHDNDKQNTLVKQETKELKTKLSEQLPKADQAKNTNSKIKSTVILKMDLPSTMNVDSLNLGAQSNTARDGVERRVAELNRVFKEFIGLWRKPNGDPTHSLILGNENSDFASKPVHLNALNDLMNVVENLKQPDTLDNFVKAINDEMMQDMELVSFPDNFIDHLEENTLIHKEDKDLQNPSIKGSPATEFQDLVSPNKLAKQNDFQEKSDNKDSSIIKPNEQSSRISKRVAVEAKSSDAKVDKKKSVVTKSAESTSAKVKSTDAKKTTDAKTTDAKTTDPKVAEARSTEAKSSKAKSAKVKHTTKTEDSKVVKAKSVEAKVVKTKSTDAEVAESKSATSAETNSDNAKSAEVKSAEVKSTDAKVADSKSADAKSADSKSADATSSDSPQLRSGGLYEEYKNKLREILTANDNQRRFLSKMDNSEKEDRTCHCDERRTLSLAVGADGATVSNSPLQCHCDASKHSNSIDGNSNNHVACHCDSQTCSVLETVGLIHPKVVANKVLFAHKKKEEMEDEDRKPYFISNSKQRQMIWNDIPLSGEKKSFDNANKNTGQIMYSRPSIAAPPVDLKPNIEHQRAPSQKNKSEVQGKKHTQLQYLVKVLQDKHRAPALRRSKKMNLLNKYNRLAALVRRAKRRDLFGGLDMNKQFGSQPSFPQVFVNQPGQVQPIGGNGGGRMLGMMAKQLNVSPVEMAQRIASSTVTEPVPMIENPLQYTSGK